MMMFHGARCIEYSQWRFGFRLEGIIRTTMIEIVTQACNQQTKYFQILHETFHATGFHHGKHGLSHIQGMAPIVIFDGTVIFTNTQDPTAQNIIGYVKHLHQIAL